MDILEVKLKPTNLYYFIIKILKDAKKKLKEIRKVKLTFQFKNQLNTAK
jgi:hypothetical protein